MDSFNSNVDQADGSPTIMADQTADIVTDEAQIPLECAIDESALVKKVRLCILFLERPKRLVFSMHIISKKTGTHYFFSVC